MIRRISYCLKTPRNFSGKMRERDPTGTGWKGERWYPRPKIKWPKVRLQLHVLPSDPAIDRFLRAFPPSGSVVTRTKDESHARNEFCSLDETVFTSLEQHRVLTSWENREEKLPNSCRAFVVRLFFLFTIYIYIFKNIHSFHTLIFSLFV